MEFDLEKTLAALSRTPATLKALLEDLPRDWTENNEGPWQAYISILHDRKK